MRQVIIAIILGFLLIGGIYVFCPTIKTAANLVLVGKDIFFPSNDDNAKKKMADNKSSLPEKSVQLDDFAAKFSNSLMTMEDGKPQNFERRETGRGQILRFLLFGFMVSALPGFYSRVG